VKTWRITLRLLGQDWRSGELYLLASALILTVAAITAVGFFTDRVESAMARQGGELIAADLALESATPLPADYREQADRLGLTSAEIIEFRSVVVGEGGPQLVQVKAVDTAYPLRGRLSVRDAFDAPDREVETGPPPGEVWVESRLLPLLGAALGDEVGLGESRLRMGAILSNEPDRGGALFALAPRVMLSQSDLAATGLITEASRAEHRLLVAGEASAVERFKRDIEAGLPVNIDLVDGSTARPEFESAVDRASRFLHLATLVTLLVAGAAIALASRRFVERQTDAVAVMRCLGAPNHLLMRVFMMRLALFGLIASLVGCLLGWLGQLGLMSLLSDWFATDLPTPSLAPVFVGVATGLVALLGFALPPLFQLAQVSPLRALRRDLGAPRGSAILTVLGAASALALLIIWQADDFQLAWKLMAGVLGAVASLVITVLVLVRLAGGLAGRARGVWRLGLAALARRPSAAVLQISGLGLGILALLLLAVVRVDLLAAWQETLPEGAPNHFLINIQPQDVEPLGEFLREADLGESAIYPMIRGRLVRINDREIVPSDFENPRAEQLASREFNLSQGAELQSDNRIVAGAWWSGADAPPEFSVEEGIAETLGIALGDEIAFLVSGREVSAPVTSLREVQWDSFNVNFFVISSPALLGSEPATYITSFYLPEERESVIPELVKRFPSVTLLDVDALLTQVRQVVDRGVMAVEYVFLFTLAAGILVMYAGIQASLEERRLEHGILRTLGTGRRALLTSLAVEFTAAGILAGALASVFAELTGWLLAEQLFGLTFSFNPMLWLISVFGSGALIGIAGTLATYPLLIRPPLHTLRQAG
jgi:putative ABC transport system permease protein